MTTKVISTSIARKGQNQKVGGFENGAYNTKIKAPKSK